MPRSMFARWQYQVGCRGFQRKSESFTPEGIISIPSLGYRSTDLSRHSVVPAINRDQSLAFAIYNPQGNQGKSYIVKVGNVNLWNNALLTPTELQAQNLRDFGSILILILRSGNSADEEKFKAMTEQNQKKYIDNCIACKTYPDLGDIVKECLYGEHIEADCYTKIRQRLQAIMIQDAIGDEEGIEFWSKYFAEQTSLSISVPITRFVETLFEWVAIPANVEAVVYWEEELSKIGNIRDRLSSISLGGDYSDSTSTSSDGEYLSSNDSGDEEEAKHPYERPPEEHILYFRLLKQVFGERASTGTRTSNHSSLQVSVLNFGRILKWYGPLNSTKYKAKIENKLSDLLMNVVERIEKTLRYDFFHGNIDGIVAQERLQKFDGDTYLIRLSSQPGFFVLSRNRVSSKSQQRVFDEGRISYVHGMGFSLDSTEYHTSLGKFVARYKKPLRLKVKCKGSQNTPLFSPRRNPYAALF
eukprot:TRINITY_DN3003_c0_g1_i1.p1 TRINITY_DN3003_c0_g1~~TRINITY_DN3003_c0_g1_i1.p1  ORF type:complete len:471 (-),score=38.43 TRINITY_DN3003_c0_g1_i1:755-2167(-)